MSQENDNYNLANMLDKAEAEAEEWRKIAQRRADKLAEAVEIARTAIGAIETIYGHAQFCDQCQSFEIAKQCRDELHGFDRLNSLENDQVKS